MMSTEIAGIRYQKQRPKLTVTPCRTMALNDATVEDKALAVSASHLEGKEDSANKDIHELIIDRQHEQVLLTSRLEGEAQKIKRIKRKLDIRLVFATAVLYVWAYIDRGNLGNALLAGMGEDLKLDGTNRYSTLAQMFFVTYILMELPSTLILRKVNAAIWLPSTVVVFGIITLGQGFVKSWGALLVCRLLLGFGEGAFITVGIYIIGMWYDLPSLSKAAHSPSSNRGKLTLV